MANTDYPYDDPYYGYYDPYYGFYGEPYNSLRNGWNGPYNYIPPDNDDMLSNNTGPYVGYGPRNYRRSDERVREGVNGRLWSNGQLDASDITVTVDDGVSTLTGSVDSRWAKRKAEDNAWSVPGVVDVLNNLVVSRNWDTWRAQMHLGMDVVGSMGRKIGTVEEIRDFNFLVDRTNQPDIYIPYTAVQAVRNDRVILNVAADDVNNMNWATTDTIPA